MADQLAADGPARARNTSGGVHAGPVDTDMAKDLTLPKVTPMDIARQALRGLEAEQDEVLSVDWTRQVKAGLSAEPGIYLDYDPERSPAAAR